jgi:hypothetical protein
MYTTVHNLLKRLNQLYLALVTLSPFLSRFSFLPPLSCCQPLLHTPHPPFPPTTHKPVSNQFVKPVVARDGQIYSIMLDLPHAACNIISATARTPVRCTHFTEGIVLVVGGAGYVGYGNLGGMGCQDWAGHVRWDRNLESSSFVSALS